MKTTDLLDCHRRALSRGKIISLGGPSGYGVGMIRLGEKNN
jgi:hypothetical protein